MYVHLSCLALLATACSESAIRGADDDPETGDTAGGGDDGGGNCSSFVNRRDLGRFSLDGSGLSEAFTFDVPRCAGAFMLIIEGPDDVTMVLDRLTSPSGDVWLEGPYPLGQLTSTMRMTGGEGVATALVSNSDQDFEAGTYEAVILGGRVDADPFGGGQFVPFDGRVRVELLWKGADTLAEGGAVDVNLFFTGAGGWTAATAPTDDTMQAALARFTEIYDAGDLGIGDVHYRDVPARFSTITSLAGPGNMLSEMFAESSVSEGGLNFFFVDRFDVYGGLGAAIGGISGGVPGPALRPGSPRSGVAVALAAGRGQGGALDPDLVAHVMAHEGGHYLGLFHTSEFIGIDDPLSDTPAGANGSTNLMFPAVGGGTTITGQQSRVLHHHPEVELEVTP